MIESDRFWSKVALSGPEECWNWLGQINHYGYGVFWFNRKNVKAHRFSYELTRSLIPDGLRIDHLCRNKSCVNPGHLEVVSLAENNRRAKAAIFACPAGHNYDAINTRKTKLGKRVCRQCERDRKARKRGKA